jgi:hypothetical protein
MTREDIEAFIEVKDENVSRLILFGHLIQLIQGKNRSVFTNKLFADVAPASNSEVAFSQTERFKF